MPGVRAGSPPQPWGAGFGPGAALAGAGGLPELGSAFCSSHQVATTLLGWPPALGVGAGGPGQSPSRAGQGSLYCDAKGKLLFHSCFFFS